jgi:hypothetical protein
MLCCLPTTDCWFVNDSLKEQAECYVLCHLHQMTESECTAITLRHDLEIVDDGSFLLSVEDEMKASDMEEIPGGKRTPDRQPNMAQTGAERPRNAERINLCHHSEFYRAMHDRSQPEAMGNHGVGNDICP